MGTSLDSLSLDAGCDSGAAKIARDALRVPLETGGRSCDDGLLVASELVTNAVQYSGGSSVDQLRVDIVCGPECVLISVHDPGLTGQEAEPAQAERPGPGGWGLRLVEMLSLRWGTERPDGYRVWAELPVIQVDHGCG